jgi:hypothetical protein
MEEPFFISIHTDFDVNLYQRAQRYVNLCQSGDLPNNENDQEPDEPLFPGIPLYEGDTINPLLYNFLHMHIALRYLNTHRERYNREQKATGGRKWCKSRLHYGKSIKKRRVSKQHKRGSRKQL